jgi:glycosyltransferase involved in cell wall biosynthesis
MLKVEMNKSCRVGVVIPAYKSKDFVLSVIERIGAECDAIFVIDDACPQGTGIMVQDKCTDRRLQVLFHPLNLGVGGAVMTGYVAALYDGCEVIVKIDSDGQMDPELVPLFIEPILNGSADYVKGNRFYDLTHIKKMPGVRILGNAVLSFMSKFSTGYWDIFDPTNGYTAIHARVVANLPLDKISQRYFFESDMLFRLNTMRCVVVDVPMDAHYADETSSLKIKQIVFEFLSKHVRNFGKRIFYNYFLRDLSAASFQLVFGLVLFLFGGVFGVVQWWQASSLHVNSSAGTVMLAAMPLLVGVQLLLAFLSFDVQSVPRMPVYKRLQPKKKLAVSVQHSDTADKSGASHG